MLLNIEIKITITNDGNKNTVNLNANQDLTVQEILTSLKMADNMILGLLKENYKEGEDLNNWLRTIKLKDIL